MKFWIIRSKLNKKYIPYPSKGRRAKTHVSLTDTDPPRLFKTRGQAKQALDWWLKGEWYTKYDGEWGTSLSFDGILESNPKLDRIPEEMEIVLVSIEEISFTRILDSYTETTITPET